jgi:hypothetical protein
MFRPSTSIDSILRTFDIEGCNLRYRASTNATCSEPLADPAATVTRSKPSADDAASRAPRSADAAAAHSFEEIDDAAWDLSDILKWDHRSGSFPLTDRALKRMVFTVPSTESDPIETQRNYTNSQEREKNDLLDEAGITDTPAVGSRRINHKENDNAKTHDAALQRTSVLYPTQSPSHEPEMARDGSGKSRAGPAGDDPEETVLARSKTKDSEFELEIPLARSKTKRERRRRQKSEGARVEVDENALGPASPLVSNSIAKRARYDDQGRLVSKADGCTLVTGVQ